MLSYEAEVIERLNRLARMIGRVFAVDLGVDELGDRLIFVDMDGDPIMADGQEIVAATKVEIDEKRELDDFAVRAFRAALIFKSWEIEQSRTP